METDCFDVEAREVVLRLPPHPRVVAIGSMAFWNSESAGICKKLGALLADIQNLVLVTGGVSGTGESIGRAFHVRRTETGGVPSVFHVLPRGETPWEYGQTIFAGADMAERREILGRLALTYVAVEGGPGTEHEATVATANGAVVIPVGRSGGFSATLHSRSERPGSVSEDDWRLLASSTASPHEVAHAACRAIVSCVAR